MFRTCDIAVFILPFGYRWKFEKSFYKYILSLLITAYNKTKQQQN